jgi:hypothetical protein
MFCGQLDYNLLFLWFLWFLWFLDMHWGKPGFDLSGIGSPGWWSPRLKPQSGAALTGTTLRASFFAPELRSRTSWG